MTIQHPFTTKLIPILEQNGISVTAFSGQSELDIDLSTYVDSSDIGQIWINGIEGSENGEIVIRNHAASCTAEMLEPAVNELTKKAVSLLEYDESYTLTIETRIIPPDINDPEDIPVLYTVTSYLTKIEYTPAGAFGDLLCLFKIPKSELTAILEIVNLDTDKH